MLAARTNGVAAVRLLIERGANVNVVERWQGQTPLMYAAAHDRAEVARALIAAGADANAKTPLSDLPARLPAARFNVEFPAGGMTAVLLAARQGATGALRVLIEAHANIETATPEGFTHSSSRSTTCTTTPRSCSSTRARARRTGRSIRSLTRAIVCRCWVRTFIPRAP
jgi:ankyrin repeat protein